jgi:hypothetical protein
LGNKFDFTSTTAENAKTNAYMTEWFYPESKEDRWGGGDTKKTSGGAFGRVTVNELNTRVTTWYKREGELPHPLVREGGKWKKGGYAELDNKIYNFIRFPEGEEIIDLTVLSQEIPKTKYDILRVKMPVTLVDQEGKLSAPDLIKNWCCIKELLAEQVFLIDVEETYKFYFMYMKKLINTIYKEGGTAITTLGEAMFQFKNESDLLAKLEQFKNIMCTLVQKDPDLNWQQVALNFENISTSYLNILDKNMGDEGIAAKNCDHCDWRQTGGGIASSSEIQKGGMWGPTLTRAWRAGRLNAWSAKAKLDYGREKQYQADDIADNLRKIFTLNDGKYLYTANQDLGLEKYVAPVAPSVAPSVVPVAPSVGAPVAPSVAPSVGAPVAPQVAPVAPPAHPYLAPSSGDHHPQTLRQKQERKDKQDDMLKKIYDLVQEQQSHIPEGHPLATSSSMSDSGNFATMFNTNEDPKYNIITFKLRVPKDTQATQTGSTALPAVIALNDMLKGWQEAEEKKEDSAETDNIKKYLGELKKVTTKMMKQYGDTSEVAPSPPSYPALPSPSPSPSTPSEQAVAADDDSSSRPAPDSGKSKKKGEGARKNTTRKKTKQK